MTANPSTYPHVQHLVHKYCLVGLVVLQVAPGDESVMRGKSQGGGCCIKKTNTALVIGTYESPVQPGDVNVVVENLGDYLLQSQY